MRRFFRPGDVLAWVIAVLMPGLPPCGECRERQAALNDWGWRGLWRHRREVTTWLGGSAWAAGHRRVEPGCRLWLALVGVALIELSRRGRAMPVQTAGNGVAESLKKSGVSGR